MKEIRCKPNMRPHKVGSIAKYLGKSGMVELERPEQLWDVTKINAEKMSQAVSEYNLDEK